MPGKRVLLATRPLTPPWDEASKNFAYFLGKSVIDHSLTLLTTRNGLPGLPPSANENALYESGVFGWNERLTLLNYLQTVRDQFDVTHYLFTPTRLNTALIKLLARPTRGKTIQTVATLRRDLYSDQTIRSVLFADQIVVYTDESRRRIEALGKKNVTRIYPGIDLDKYVPQPKFHPLIQSLGLEPDDFIVVYPGEYVRLGATELLTRTFIQFFQEHPETKMRFLFACRVKDAQDAKKKAWAKREFEKAGVSLYIRFTDTIADMPSLYNAADVVIFPVQDLKGKFDVPLVIIEAYACGKPVILTDLPEFREFTGPDFSVTIPKASGESLIQTLLTLEAQPEERARLGARARDFVTAHFDLKHTAATYSHLYDSL